MADTRHRDLYRVWHTIADLSTEYATYVHAVSAKQAMEIGERKIRKSLDPGRQFEVLRAEKR